MKKWNLTIRKFFNYALVVCCTLLAPQIASADTQLTFGSIVSNLGNFGSTVGQSVVQTRNAFLDFSSNFQKQIASQIERSSQTMLHTTRSLVDEVSKNINETKELAGDVVQSASKAVKETSVKTTEIVKDSIVAVNGKVTTQIIPTVQSTISTVGNTVTESSEKATQVASIQSASVTSALNDGLEKVYGFAIDKTANVLIPFFIRNESVKTPSLTIQNFSTTTPKVQSAIQIRNEVPVKDQIKDKVDTPSNFVIQRTSVLQGTPAVSSSPRTTVNDILVQNILRRLAALELRGVIAAPINQYITNTYTGGTSYSVPADTTSYTNTTVNTVVNAAVTSLQEQISLISSSGAATNTFAFIIATSTTATSTFAGNIDVDGNLEVGGNITAAAFYGDGSNLTGITSFSTSTTRGVLSAGNGLGYNSTTGVFSIATSSLSTSDFSEGSNLYFTNDRVDARIGIATTTIQSMIPNSYVRPMFSSSATGLTYNNASGDFSLTSGYSIPLTSSTTEWASKVSSQWTTSGSDIYYTAGKVGIGTTSPSAKLAITGTAGSGDILNIASSTEASLFKIASTGATYFNNDAGTTGMVLLSNGTGSSPTWVATSSLGISGGGASLTGTTGQIAYFNGTDTAIGTSTIFISTAGNIGIGTTNPLYKLEIAGTASTTALNLPSTTSASVGTINMGGNRFIHGYNTSSFFAGTNAGSFTAGTGYNTGVGASALAVVTGWGNVAVGASAGAGMTSGVRNIAIGYATLSGAVTGSDNAMIGYGVSGGAVSGNYNAALGATAASLLVSGSANVTIGYASGYNLGSGSNNVLLGYYAGSSVTGSNNIMLGYQAGNNLTTGTNNIIIGYDIDATTATTTQSLNIGNLIFGTGLNGTGTTLSTGNIGIGTTTPSSKLTVVGTTTVDGILHLPNTSIIRSSTDNILISSSSMGTIFLGGAGSVTSAGSHSIGIGSSALANVSSSGSYNIGIGYRAGTAITSAARNISIGANAGDANQSSPDNVAVGYDALTAMSGTSIANTAVGNYALSGLTTNSHYNVALGMRAGSTLTSGVGNIIIGSGNNGDGVSTPSTTSSNTLNIGGVLWGTNVNTVTGSSIAAGNIGIGTSTPSSRLAIAGASGATTNLLTVASSTGASLFAISSAGNVGIGTSTPGQTLAVVGTIQSTALLGGSTNLTVDANGNIIRDPSDEALKENIITLEDSLSKIMQLRGVRYEWKDKTRFGTSTEIGVIAQEVEMVVPEVVSSGGIYKSVNIKNLVALLIEGVKDLKVQVDVVKDKVLAISSWFSSGGDRLDVKGLICVDDVCVTKDQFKQILINSGSVMTLPASTGSAGTGPGIESGTEASPSDISTGETSSSTSVVSNIPQTSSSNGTVTTSTEQVSAPSETTEITPVIESVVPVATEPAPTPSPAAE